MPEAFLPRPWKPWRGAASGGCLRSLIPYVAGHTRHSGIVTRAGLIPCIHLAPGFRGRRTGLCGDDELPELRDAAFHGNLDRLANTRLSFGKSGTIAGAEQENGKQEQRLHARISWAS